MTPGEVRDEDRAEAERLLTECLPVGVEWEHNVPLPTKCKVAMVTLVASLLAANREAREALEKLRMVTIRPADISGGRMYDEAVEVLARLGARGRE